MSRVKERILALDLALGLTGYAVVDTDLTIVATGTFSLPDRKKEENRGAWNTRRYKVFIGKIIDLLVTYEPSTIAYEYPDKPRSVYTEGGRARANKGTEFHAMQGLGLAEGFLISACHGRADEPPFAVSTTEAKYLSTGKKNASKQAVREAMEYNFRKLFAENMKMDESDALSIAFAAFKLMSPYGVVIRAALEEPKRKTNVQRNRYLQERAPAGQGGISRQAGAVAVSRVRRASQAGATY